MKNQFGNIKNIIVLCMALLLGPVVNAQVGSDNGIHVSGGSSSQSKVSSNIGNSTTATGYNSFASGYGSEASGQKPLHANSRWQVLPKPPHYKQEH